MKVAGIIPARYASTRFPGKPLADIRGKPMIRRVYEQAQKASSLNIVCVATDDLRIFDSVEAFGGNALMTAKNHNSGTDRCNEAIRLLESEGEYFDIAVNIQGDEPFIDPAQIDEVVSCFSDPEVRIATLAKKIEDNRELFNPNVNKLIIDRYGDAVYFSRQPLPFRQNIPEGKWLKGYNYYKHIGIYAYRTEVLKKISALEISLLEKAEALEQLRWIENGYKIRVRLTELESFSIDTPEDLSKFLNIP